MNQMLVCDWLCKEAKWAYLVLRVVTHETLSSLPNIMNLLLTELLWLTLLASNHVVFACL